jgi:hypothetical protein
VTPSRVRCAGLSRHDEHPGVSAGTPGGQRRAELLVQLEAAADPRIERYWELTAVISGRGPFPSVQRALEWPAAALRASQGRKDG